MERFYQAAQAAGLNGSVFNDHITLGYGNARVVFPANGSLPGFARRTLQTGGSDFRLEGTGFITRLVTFSEAFLGEEA